MLIADSLVPQAALSLREAGHEVVEDPGLKEDALTAALSQHRPDALVVRSTRVTAAHLEASGSLSLVVRAGAGVNTIDLQAAGQRGVFVANCPGCNAVAVAELVMGMLVALDRQLPENVIAARAGQWRKGAFGKAQGLMTRRLGLVGMGSIGREVASRALAFGMEVVACSRSLTPEGARKLGITHAKDALDVARQCSILSVHTALAPQTRALVGPELLAAMPDGSWILNTSRAEMVDEAALRDALDHRGFRAALDVFSGEPAGKHGELSHPLASHPSVLLTHHIGASTQQAQEAVAAEAVRVLLAFDATGRAPNTVNLQRRTRATHGLVVRHRDRVGVLASVLDALRQAQINVQEMENTIFEGGGAALARVQVHVCPSAAVLDRLSALPDVLHVTCVPIPGASS